MKEFILSSFMNPVSKVWSDASRIRSDSGIFAVGKTKLAVPKKKLKNRLPK